jgi:hypothetical protein
MNGIAAPCCLMDYPGKGLWRLRGIKPSPWKRPEVVAGFLRNRDGRIRPTAVTRRRARPSKLAIGVEPEAVEGHRRGAGGGLDSLAFAGAGEECISRQRRYPPG